MQIMINDKAQMHNRKLHKHLLKLFIVSFQINICTIILLEINVRLETARYDGATVLD